MFEIRADGVVVDTSDGLDRATVAAIDLKDRSPLTSVVIHDLRSGHRLPIGTDRSPERPARPNLRLVTSS